MLDSTECDDVHGGWYYDDPDHPTRVVACDSSCRVMQSDHHARVERQPPEGAAPPDRGRSHLTIVHVRPYTTAP